ncbi:MAG: hypothetical protein AAFP04_02960 [Myxococcota bacterium]
MLALITHLVLTSSGSTGARSQVSLEVALGRQGSPQSCALLDPDCGIGGTSLSIGAGLVRHHGVLLYGISFHGEATPFEDDIAYYTAAMRLPAGIEGYGIRSTLAPKLGFARHDEVVGRRTFFDPDTFETFGTETYKTLMLLGFDTTLSVVFDSWLAGIRFEALATSRPAFDLTQENLGGGARLGGWLVLEKVFDIGS